MSDGRAFLEELAARAGEHFDHVIILASSDTAEESTFEAAGAGNVYARCGLAEAFLQRQHERDRAAMQEKDED